MQIGAVTCDDLIGICRRWSPASRREENAGFVDELGRVTIRIDAPIEWVLAGNGCWLARPLEITPRVSPQVVGPTVEVSCRSRRSNDTSVVA